MQDLGLFPFEKLRDVQKDFLRDAREALCQGKFLLANAPTGLGKTAVALTASVEYALKNSYVVFFLTSRQFQHKIAIETLSRMRRKERRIVVADMIGKRSMCIADNIKNSRFFEELCSASIRTHSCKFAKPSAEIVRRAKEVPVDVEEIISLGIEKKACPYLCATELGREANVIVCDYNYLFSEISEIVLQKLEIGLENIVVVVDEAHNLPDRIRANYTKMLSIPDFEEGAKEVARIEPNIAGLLRGIHQVLAKQRFEQETRLERDYFEKIFDAVCAQTLTQISFSEFLEKLDLLSLFLSKQGVVECYIPMLLDFLKTWALQESALLRFAKEDFFVCEMLDTSKVGQRVFENSPGGILMSATLYPIEMYREILGIPQERAVMKYYPSPFPKEHRLLLAIPGLTSRYKARGNEMYLKYAQAIARISNVVPGNIAVFYTSYQMMDEISKHLAILCSKPMLYERPDMSKAEKTRMLKMLEDYRRDGAILHAVLGGSLSEGIDFKNNLLSAVVITGLPIPPPSLENLAIEQFLIEKYGREKGYAYARLYPALNKVLQAAGRCIRSESDRAIIFLLDYRFNSHWYKRYLPEDFRPSILKNLEETVKNFFA